MRPVFEGGWSDVTLQKTHRNQGFGGVRSLGESSLKWSYDFAWSVSGIMNESRGA